MNANNLSIQNAHPRDANIRFQEEGHKYTILTDPTSKYTSCTTWNHSHFAKFDADAVVASMMKGKNWNPANKYWGMTADQIKQQWASSGQAAAQAGTQMHYQIECFMNNPRLLSQLSSQQRSSRLSSPYTHKDLYHDFMGGDGTATGTTTATTTGTNTTTTEFMFFIEFIRNTPNLVPYRTEWLIYDERVRISGSVDMVYENQEDGTLAIYDWKRSAKIEKTNGWGKTATTECISHLPDTNFWHYALQLNTYKTIIERNYGRKVSALFLVRLHPDNPNKSYELLRVPFLEEEMANLFDERLSA
jgi:ATP-dependent exoDNAse (exonuclease V) beta subunit